MTKKAGVYSIAQNAREGNGCRASRDRVCSPVEDHQAPVVSAS
ncbi:MAG: hypothetical protein PVJ23_09365 [Anaerolineae bacterium]